MDLKEYSQKAHQFAQYNDFKYVEYGLVNEISEVLEVYAKAYRGDYDMGGEEFLSKLRKECGDVCWLANEMKPLDEISVSDFEVIEESDILSDLVDCIPHCVGEMWYDQHPENLVTEIVESVRDLLKIRGIKLEDVLEQNIAKLSERAKSGTIKGSGDSR